MTLLLAVLIVSVSTGAWAEEVHSGQIQSVTVRTRAYVPERPLTLREQAFLATVPEWAMNFNMREGCRQMLLSGVIHVPLGGVYLPEWALKYVTSYQDWTGPHEVKIPIAPGSPGRPGQDGIDGKDGKDGRDGKDGVTKTIVVHEHHWHVPPAPAYEVGPLGANPMGTGDYYPDDQFDLGLTATYHFLPSRRPCQPEPPEPPGEEACPPDPIGPGPEPPVPPPP